MDKQSRDRFETILRSRRDELQSRMNTARRQKDPSGLSEAKDEGDRATASTAAEMSVAQASQAESLLRVITSALNRIKDGTFGECMNCRQGIGLQRLEAIPWARYCISCQELIDGSSL